MDLQNAGELFRLTSNADEDGYVTLYYGHDTNLLTPVYGNYYVGLNQPIDDETFTVYRYATASGEDSDVPEELGWRLATKEAIALGSAAVNIKMLKGEILRSDQGSIRFHYSASAPTANSETDVWVNTSTGETYIREYGAWAVIQRDWNYWDRIPGTFNPAAGQGGGVNVTTLNGTATPVVFYNPHADNKPENIAYVNANLATKLEGKFVTKLISDMYITFFGRKPELGGLRFWLETVIVNPAFSTIDILAKTIYNAGINDAVTSSANIKPIVGAEPATNEAVVDPVITFSYVENQYEPATVTESILAEDGISGKETGAHPDIEKINIIPIFRSLMKEAVGKDSIYIRTKETLNDFLTKDVDESTQRMTQSEQANVLSQALVSMSTSITAQAMTAAYEIAKEDRDGVYEVAKLEEEIRTMKEQRDAVKLKGEIDRRTANVELAIGKAKLTELTRKYTEDDTKWQVNKDMLLNQKIVSDIDVEFKRGMAERDLLTKDKTIEGMDADRAFNESKKILMEATRKDNIRMKATEQYAEFLKYISAANVVPGEHHFENLVGLVNSIIKGQNDENDAWAMKPKPDGKKDTESAPMVIKSV